MKSFSLYPIWTSCAATCHCCPLLKILDYSWSLPWIKLHSLLSAYRANFLYCLSAVLFVIWQSIMFSGHLIFTGRYSVSHWRRSKPLNMRAKVESWNIDMALPVNVHLLPVRSVEILFFHDSKVHAMAILSVPTQHIKPLRPGVANIQIQQAFFALIPVIPHVKGYNSHPLILARLKGCKSKDGSPLDSCYRRKCEFLNVRYEIQPPFHLNTIGFVCVYLWERVQALTVV